MNFIDIGLYIAYLAFFIAIASLFLFPVLSLFKGNIKNAKASLIGVAVLAAILIISYVISPADQGQFYTKMNTGPGQSKLIGAGLVSTYIVFAALVVITLYTIVVKWFK
jgi:uncharacterized membrane protein YwaF